MNDPLADLKDIHLPAEIGWWPLAPGWWFLIIFTFAIVTAVVLLLRYRKKNSAYRKAALQELAYINTHTQADEAYIEAVAALLRRTAISAEKKHSSEQSVAHLQGKEWQQYLQKFMPVDVAQWIAIDRYQAQPNINRQALQTAAESWIKRHKS